MKNYKEQKHLLKSSIELLEQVEEKERVIQTQNDYLEKDLPELYKGQRGSSKDLIIEAEKDITRLLRSYKLSMGILYSYNDTTL